MKLLNEDDIIFNKKYLIKLRHFNYSFGYLSLTELLRNMPEERQENVKYKVNFKVGNSYVEGSITEVLNVYLPETEEEINKMKLLNI